MNEIDTTRTAVAVGRVSSTATEMEENSDTSSALSGVGRLFASKPERVSVTLTVARGLADEVGDDDVGAEDGASEAGNAVGLADSIGLAVGAATHSDSSQCLLEQSSA